MAKRFIQVVFITMPTLAPAGRRPRVRLRSTTIAYRNHRDDTKTRDAPPASPRSRVDGRGHAAGRSLPPPSPPARAPIQYRALATTRRVSAMLDRPPTRIFRCRRHRLSVRCLRVPRATAPSRSRIFPDDIPGRNPLSTRPVLSLTPPLLSFADRSFATLPATTVRRPRNRPSLSVPERRAPSLRSSGGARQ